MGQRWRQKHAQQARWQRCGRRTLPAGPIFPGLIQLFAVRFSKLPCPTRLVAHYSAAAGCSWPAAQWPGIRICGCHTRITLHLHCNMLCVFLPCPTPYTIVAQCVLLSCRTALPTPQ